MGKHDKIFQAINRLTEVVRTGPRTYSPKSSETKYTWGASKAIDRLLKRVLK